MSAEPSHDPVHVIFNPERGDEATDEASKVDRIRDILFGSQMRDYDGRFQRLEERVAHESAEARQQVQKRIEGLENLLKGEVQSLVNRLNAEQGERRGAIEKLAHDLAETARAFESKIKNLDERTAGEIHNLREQLLEQSKALGAEIKEKHEQMLGQLNHETGQIRHAMTGRESLAEMLSEISLRLKNEFSVPGA
jgi:phage host-nuclease inhibitor protein Gam